MPEELNLNEYVKNNDCSILLFDANSPEEAGIVKSFQERVTKEGKILPLVIISNGEAVKQFFQYNYKKPLYILIFVKGELQERHFERLEVLDILNKL